MIISVEIDGLTYHIDQTSSIDLAIPLNFNGPQPNAYGAEQAASKPCEAGSLVGDTRQGGSCNFEQYTFIPHCNGTHTESIGHITKERITILGSLKDAFVPAVLISVEPESAAGTTDTYAPEKGPDDRLITRAGLENALKEQPPGSVQYTALIIRTLPNDDSKKTRDYMKEPAPFFSLEAIRYIVELGFEHLLVDLPSIDRAFDEGKLSAHRIFWNMPPGSQETDEESRIHRTVTEMIYVSNEIEDGPYLLNLQIAPFAADAAPSRPLLFNMQQTNGENFERFRRCVLSDLSLQEQLQGIEDKKKFIAATVELGAANGFVFSTLEVESAMRRNQQQWIERWM